ncbi:hypothetical protein B5807_09535 [Epicoccum nigrum]|uniref:Uncharacterized protein n=1 Tax=Epicoccum nigrum TaxID=105696 RepID=A0A1Y2LPR1_EPING|nr:hypothetical protein B5807_09535 [Epicoccum nigrum]
MAVTPWQFKFFDVSQVKLADDESAFLAEVCHQSPPPVEPFSPTAAREHYLRRRRFRERLRRQR